MLSRSRSSELSKKRIDAIVEQLIADPDINIKYFPDGIERQMYRNIFTIMINLLDNLVDTTSINFMGHKLVFDFQPMNDNEIEAKTKTKQENENSTIVNGDELIHYNNLNSRESNESRESREYVDSIDNSKSQKKKSRIFKKGLFSSKS
jgi:hypothetical protein